MMDVLTKQNLEPEVHAVRTPDKEEDGDQAVASIIQGMPEIARVSLETKQDTEQIFSNTSPNHPCIETSLAATPWFCDFRTVR